MRHRNNLTCSMLAHCASGGSWLLPGGQGEHLLAGFLGVLAMPLIHVPAAGCCMFTSGSKQLLLQIPVAVQPPGDSAIGLLGSNQRGSGGGQVSHIHSLQLPVTSAPQAAFYYLSLVFTTSPFPTPILGAQISSVASCCNSPMLPVYLLSLLFPLCAQTTQIPISYRRILRLY